MNAIGAGIEVKDITFSDGSLISCEGYDVILVVGPNNSGKTHCLLDISDLIRAHASLALGTPPGAAPGTPPRMVVKLLNVARSGTPDEVWAVIQKIGSRDYNWPEEQYQIDRNSPTMLRPISRSKIEGWTDAPGGHPAEVAFLTYLRADAREQMADPVQSIDFGRMPRTHPLHHLHEDPELRKRLSDTFRLAFGQEIALDFTAGITLPLHVGERAFPRGGEAAFDNNEYRDRLRSYPRIKEQGHGMRSFAGTLLHAWTAPAGLVLIDEPEAFLHPPQARLLARLLADQHDPGKQLIIATHSIDIIRGTLDCPGIRVKVIRLRRDGDRNIARELTHEDIEGVWADPVTRYSNILDGLFFDRVVVCEADGDCRFYHAIADAIRDNNNNDYLRDVMFAQAGGKGGMAKLVRALRKLEVPVVVAADFDVLRDQSTISSILEALGGQMRNVEADYNIVRCNIDKMGKVPAADIKRNITALLDRVNDSEESLPPKVVQGIQSELKPYIGWRKAKATGIGMLDPGTARRAGVSLLNSLAETGFLLVPGGELESFDPIETAEKNEWVNRVLEKYRGRFATATELEDARRFVRKMLTPLLPSSSPPSPSTHKCSTRRSAATRRMTARQ